MAAKAGAKNDSPGPGHNEPPAPLTDEQRDALYLTHVAQARQDNLTLEKALEAVRAVRKVRTRNRNLCRTDGWPLAHLDRNLKREEMTYEELCAEAKVHAQMDRAQGLPTTGEEQIDLFGNAVTVKGDPSLDHDDGYWAAIGYMAGKKGIDQAIPDYVPPEHGNAWHTGYADGQKVLADAWIVRKEIEGRREA